MMRPQAAAVDSGAACGTEARAWGHAGLKPRGPVFPSGVEGLGRRVRDVSWPL